MIKKTIVSIILACAACCTVPLFIPVLAGASVFGFQLFQGPPSIDSILCAIASALLVAAGVYLAFRLFMAWQRKKKVTCSQTACQTGGKCGCK